MSTGGEILGFVVVKASPKRWRVAALMEKVRRGAQGDRFILAYTLLAKSYRWQGSAAEDCYRLTRALEEGNLAGLVELLRGVA